jgi:hypothetical protein
MELSILGYNFTNSLVQQRLATSPASPIKLTVHPNQDISILYQKSFIKGAIEVC